MNQFDSNPVHVEPQPRLVLTVVLLLLSVSLFLFSLPFAVVALNHAIKSDRSVNMLRGLDECREHADLAERWRLYTIISMVVQVVLVVLLIVGLIIACS